MERTIINIRNDGFRYAPPTLHVDMSFPPFGRRGNRGVMDSCFRRDDMKDVVDFM